ncbi:MAG: aldehyde dehydrogenase family protein [Verrucomicrobia bacterium]|nr:aldehyde dehydrogenase family protein [Verrucomicrobiota bacterium]
MIPKTPFQYQLWIDGNEVPSVSGKKFERKSPAHGTVVGEYALADGADVDVAVRAAREAFDKGAWPHTSGAERMKVLLKARDFILQQKEQLALIETLESGKPISQARDEVDWTADLWQYAASLCRNIHGDTYNTLGDSMFGLVVREPIGVVGMVTPWNFPLLIVSQKLPFALAAGCTCVVKPSELTSGTTLRLGKILADAGLPDGAVNIVSGFGIPAGARLSSHPEVDMMSFTGSTNVGKGVISAARENVKKVELELGGKNPQIIFADADLPAAADAAVFGICFNQGECCNSGSRLIVQRPVVEEFVNKLIDLVRQVPVGDPLDEKNKIGAIASEAQYAKILGHIEEGQKAGARLRLGGKSLPILSGQFIEPTIFDSVSADMAIARQEIFGPVLSVLAFDTAEEAIEIANDTDYGLSASIWTRDFDTALLTSRRIRAGTIWVNTFLEGYPELPFGGFKESGLGREVGRFAIEEFTELKTIQFHLGKKTSWWARAHENLP